MPSLVLPTPDRENTKEEYTVELDGTEYRLRLYYLERTSSWYADLTLPDETPVQTGMRVCANFPLFTGTTELTPAGPILVIDGDPIPEDPRLRDLGDSVFLWYQSPDDFTEPEPDPADVAYYTAFARVAP